MDGPTLMAAMCYPGYPPPLSLARYGALAGPTNLAMHRAGCTTASRVSMMLAQVGAESGSLRWTEELADGSAYEWRTDLGNNQAGDGERFKGRSFIQITGRSHYTNLSIWAHAKGYVATSNFFVINPQALAWDQYAWLGPIWYWTIARPQMNSLADNHDIYGATLAVNGGDNNLSGRTARWNKCRSLGNAVLPGPASEEFTMDADAKKAFAAVNKDLAELRAYFTGSDLHQHTVEATVAHVTQGATYKSKKGRLWSRLFRKADEPKPVTPPKAVVPKPVTPATPIKPPTTPPVKK